MQYSQRITISGSHASYELCWRNPKDLKRGMVFEPEVHHTAEVPWKIYLYRAFDMGVLGKEVLGGSVTRLDSRSWVPTTSYIIEPSGAFRYITKDGMSSDVFATPLELSEDPIPWKELLDERKGIVSASGIKLVFRFEVAPYPRVFSAQIHSVMSKWWQESGVNGASELVNVEIITDDYITNRLSEQGSFGVVASERKRASVCPPTANALIAVLRSEMYINYKGASCYVCTRKESNQLHIGAKIKTEDRGVESVTQFVPGEWVDGQYWITVLLTRNHSSPDRICCFVKTFDLEEGTTSCLGALSVMHSRRDLNHALFEMLKSTGNLRFQTYLEKEDQETENVLSKINIRRSLYENGMYSGCCLVVVVFRPELRNYFLLKPDTEVISQWYKSNIKLSDSEEKEPSEDVASEEIEINEDLCVVCMDKAKEVILAHGHSGHKCVCEECASVIEKMSTPRCPICRQEIQMFLYATF